VRRPDDEFPSLAVLREALRDAAHREIGAPRGSDAGRGRWRRGGAALGVAALLAAGAAGAATLLATGDPAPDNPSKSAKYTPADGSHLRAGVTATDGAAGVRWAVAPYETRDGKPCVVAGQLVGERLGVQNSDVFHPYATGTAGPCGDLEAEPLFGDVRFFSEPVARTLVYGRTRAQVTTVTLRLEGRTYLARTGHGGTFLFLFKGKVDATGMRLNGR
jgi:hypothetical protein